jgi:predicted permease
MRHDGSIALAARTLARRPAFAAAVVLTLGLGVGANVAAFSVVDATLLRALPYPDPGRLVLAWEARPDRGWHRFGVSTPAFVDWRRQVTSLQHVVAFHEAQANVAGGASPERVEVLHATSGLLPALGLRPHLGRGLEPGDEAREAPVAVLGFGFWQRAFGGDPGVLGRALRVGRESLTVVGVLPPEFSAPFSNPALVRPLALGDGSGRGARWLTVLARVAPDRSPSEARAELEALARRQAQDTPATNAGWTVTVVGLAELVRENAQASLLLLGSVGLVLVLTCANVASLLLVRTLGREREFAIRSALGAGRWGLVRPVLAEAAVLGAASGAVGLGLAKATLATLWPALSASAASAPALDGRALSAAFALTTLASLLVAVLPCAHAHRAAASASLRAGGSAALTPGRRRSRRVLVVVEVAVALVLVSAAGLLVRSVHLLLAVDPGLEPRGALAFRVAPPQVAPIQGQSEDGFLAALTEDRARAAAFYGKLVERLRGLPGVTAAGAVNRLPLTGGWWLVGIEREGQAPAVPGEGRSAFGRVVTADYFDAVGLVMRAGRGFDARDGATSQSVVIVDESLARREFGGRNPLGARLRIDDQVDAEIVGIVAATHARGLEGPASPTFYVPFEQGRFGFYPDWGMDVVVRSGGELQTLAGQVRGVVQELDPGLPIFAVRTLDELVQGSLGPRRGVLRVLGAFSLLALLLAAVGLYGLLAQLAAERTREFGVRLALGARPAQVGAWWSARVWGLRRRAPPSAWSPHSVPETPSAGSCTGSRRATL